MATDDGPGSVADIACIGIHVLYNGFGDVGLVSDLAVQHRRQLADIVAFCTNQRDAKWYVFLIYQKMPSGAVFSPGLCGFCPHHLRPSGP